MSALEDFDSADFYNLFEAIKQTKFDEEYKTKLTNKIQKLLEDWTYIP